MLVLRFLAPPSEVMAEAAEPLQKVPTQEALPLEPEDIPLDEGERGPLEPEQFPAETVPLPRPDATSPTFLRPPNACPQGLEVLVARLLQDLPTYANLVASRSLGLPTERFSPFGTVIVASQPDFEPLDLAEVPYGDNDAEEIQQVFFTTLERQYWQGQSFSLQNYHWLFLAQGEYGWYLALLYSSVGSYPDGLDAPTPPQETSDGIIGQAITLWLRDCRAGAVFPPPSEPTGL